MLKKLSFVLTLTAFISFAAQDLSAQLYWDGADTTADADGGDGIWDVNNTANWDTAATGGSPATWPSAGADMVLGGASGTLTIADSTIGSGTATVLQNLTIEPGTGPFSFLAADDGGGPVVTTSPTWNLNDNRLNFVNLNDANDTALFIVGAQTLTVTGTGTLDTGERPGAAEATWNVFDATLDFQAGTLRGNPASVGSFLNVVMADGSTYVHERNADQTYINNWQLDGDVTFTNRWLRNATYTGVFSGAGKLIVADTGNGALTQTRTVRLTNPGNTFSGGVVVDSTVTQSEFQLTPAAGDGGFGAVPAAFDPDNIVLINGGQLKLNNITINSNRGITLVGGVDGGGVIVNTGAPNTYGGTITGTGGLQIGRNQGADGNRFILTSNTSDYTGGTRIFKGALELGADNAIPKDVLTIGGTQGTGSSALLFMQGFDLEVTGLRITGNQTRTIINESANDSTLTFDVAAGESYSYGANIDDRINNVTNGTLDDGTINFVKNGDGVQVFLRTSANTSWYGNVTVNDGRLRVLGPRFFDSDNDGTLDVVGNNGPRITVNNGGTLVLNAGDIVNNLQWEAADLDEVLNNGTFMAGSRLGINTDAGDFTYGTNITGVQGIEKVGGNTLTLTGTNTYSGQTVTDINNDNGVLLINGDNSGATGDVLVQNGTLGGGGTLGGNVLVSAGAAIAPGAAVATAGTLTLNGTSLTMSADDNTGAAPLVSGMEFDLDGTNTTIGGGVNDLIDGVGALTLDGTLNVAEVSAGSFLSAQANDSWRLINYSGSLVDNTLALGTLPTLGAGLSFSLDVSTPGQVNLQVVTGGGLACDLDSDGDCDLDDIDLLYATNPTTTDIGNWLTDASAPANPYKIASGGSAADIYVLGDVNLDGDVNSTDLGALLNNFNSTTGVGWGGGDLNADSIVNSNDLGLLLNNFNFTSAAVAAVPEPSGFCMLLPLIAVCLSVLRKRRR